MEMSQLSLYMALIGAKLCRTPALQKLGDPAIEEPVLFPQTSFQWTVLKMTIFFLVRITFVQYKEPFFYYKEPFVEL